MNRLSEVFHAFVSKIDLKAALCIVVFAAGAIVALGYMLYLNNPNRKYDLARPDEKDNQTLRVEDTQQGESGPVTEQALLQKIEFLKEESRVLREVGAFGPDELSDQAIQLVPSDQPSQ